MNTWLIKINRVFLNGQASFPFIIPGCSVTMPGIADVDEFAAPVICKIFCPFQ